MAGADLAAPVEQGGQGIVGFLGMVMMANDNGGHDNVSVVLVKVHKPFPVEEPAKGLFGKLFGWFN